MMRIKKSTIRVIAIICIAALLGTFIYSAVAGALGFFA